MKSTRKQFPVERLFILGAGASYSATETSRSESDTQTPLDNNFCERILTLDCQRPTWVKESRKIIEQKWKDYGDMKSYGLEEAVSKQLGHLDFINAIDTHRRYYSIKPSYYINHLSHLIVFVLKKGRENVNIPYKVFVDKVFPNTYENCKDRVITFNYDDLLDKHMLVRFPMQKVYFDKLKSNRNDTSNRREILCDAPLLLKLHGSINWHCIADAFNRIIDSQVLAQEPDTHMHIWCDRSKTPRPEDDWSPLIIPPLPAKPLSSIGIFQWLWTKAYEYLHQAKHIIVCGYSLPEIDQFAKSLFANFSSERLETITVVDPEANILGKWRNLLGRENIPKLQWQWEHDFSRYVNDMLPSGVID